MQNQDCCCPGGRLFKWMRQRSLLLFLLFLAGCSESAPTGRAEVPLLTAVPALTPVPTVTAAPLLTPVPALTPLPALTSVPLVTDLPTLTSAPLVADLPTLTPGFTTGRTGIPAPTAATPGQQAIADTAFLPEGAAPAGLGTVPLPGESDDIVAIFERLPPIVADKTRTRKFDENGPDRYSAGYGEDPSGHGPSVQIKAIDVSTGDFFPPDSTAGTVVALFAQGFDWDVLSAGRDDNLAWAHYTTRATTNDVTYQFYAMVWGRISSPWIFTAQAITSEDVFTMVSTFVAVAEEVESGQ